ncbi:VOC family protein [uncultured Roseobacter sp.]|uniref:VOC family protein n=1 Tax=uncultured Roseobacter sp. TaxID=114847 RepID=UPI0026160DD1|nr:VOC family protein [uncultured Roseobacter sp.]
MRLDHVALTVSDREDSAAFYARYFKLNQRVHEDDHLLILAGDGGSLLALSEGKVPSDLPRTNHFGFQACDVQEVQNLRARFAKDGVEEAEFQAHGPTRVQVFDPDGNRVEAYAF